MSFPNLRLLQDMLCRVKDLAVINTPVDPSLELAEIHRRAIKEQGPACIRPVARIFPQGGA